MLNSDFFIAVQSDLGFYDSIHNYFSSSWNQGDMLPSLILAASALFLLVGGGIFLMRWRASRRKYIPTGTLSEENKVRRMLSLCIDERARIDFQLNHEDGRNLFSSCIAAELTDEALILECFSDEIAPAFLYPGREIKFFFMLKAKNPEFYHFSTKVIKTVVIGKEQFQLYIRLPNELIPGQKRNFLRIDPPERLILGLAIWPYKDNKEMLKLPVRDWDEPLLVYSSEDSFQFKIRDLSASGAGLNIPRQYVELESLSFGKFRIFVLMLNLWAPVQQSPLKIWTICRVQTSLPNSDSSGLKVGVQFMAWGQLQNSSPDARLVWRKLEADEGIVPLGDWIIKRHLEGNRVHMAPPSGAII